jgi:hypothetical protein
MRVLLALLCFGLAACVPLADHPAGDEQHAVFDERLQGVWRAADDDGPMLLFASAADDDGHGIHLVTVEETGNHRWKTTEYDGIATRRGRYGFLSIRYATTDGERRGWVIARYALVGRDRLLFSTLDETRLAAGVRAETIPGRVSGDGPYADVDLTMSSVDLLAFLESKDGEKLFDPPHALTRVTTLDVRTPRARLRRGPRTHHSTGTGVAPAPAR